MNNIGLKIALTFDVEPNSSYYTEKTGDKFSGLTKAAPKVLEVFSKNKVPATWFITHDKEHKVDVDYPWLVEDMNENGEIGCHVHFRNYSVEKSWYDSSLDFQKEIIGDATHSLRDMGFRVQSFRGGNNFFNENTLKVLEEFGYKTDSSVVPGFCATPYSGFLVDHKQRLYSKPYFPTYTNHCIPGKSKILEIPITVRSYARFHMKFFSLLLGRPMSVVGLPYALFKDISVVTKDSLKLFEKEFPIVLTAHPYNFIDNTVEKINNLGSFIIKAKNELHAQFVTIDEVTKNYSDIVYPFENQIQPFILTTRNMFQFINRMPFLRKYMKNIMHRA